jgi:hypothetical protein
MDPFLARTMVESLSKGFNPVTGLPLSSQDACANEDVQDALLEVLAHCQIESTEQYLIRIKEEKEEKSQIRREQNRTRYPRGGEPWTKNEENHMMSLYRSGCNIYQIANILKRTPGAISDRMKKLQMKPIYRTRK